MEERTHIFCSRCGEKLAADAVYCMKCGHRMGESLTGPGPQQTASMPYAGFWLRVAATLIDMVVLFPVSFIITAVFGDFAWIFSTLVGWVYHAYFESSEKQATLGKIAVGIYVTDRQGNRLDFGTASLRYVAQFLNAITLGIGYLLAAFTEKKQALHDLAVGTYVVRR